jgi:hypothetical protein
MDKRPHLAVQNKTDLMLNHALCKRWDTLENIYPSLTRQALNRYVIAPKSSWHVVFVC